MPRRPKEPTDMFEEKDMERQRKRAEREKKLRERRKKRRARQKKKAAGKSKKQSENPSLPLSYFDKDTQKGKTFQLPSDLGLEAGLWIEQKNLSVGTSQHTSRGRAPPGRSKSSGGLPDRAAPGRSKSDLAVMYESRVTSQPIRRAPPGRTASDVGTLSGAGVDSLSQARPGRRAPPSRSVSDIAAHGGSSKRPPTVLPTQTTIPSLNGDSRVKSPTTTTRIIQIPPIQESDDAKEMRHHDRLRRVQELSEKVRGSATSSDARHQDRLSRVQELSAKARESHHGQSSDSDDDSNLSDESLKEGSIKTSSEYVSGSDSGSASIGTYDTNESFQSDEEFSSDMSEDRSHDKSTDMSAQTEQSESFWEKLEEENRRKAKLRAKLIGIQNAQEQSSSTQNGKLNHPGAISESASQQDRWKTPSAGDESLGRGGETPSSPRPVQRPISSTIRSPVASRRRIAAYGADGSKQGEIPFSPAITSPHQMLRRVYRPSMSSPVKETQDVKDTTEIDRRRAMPQRPELDRQSESRRSLLSVHSSVADENMRKSLYFETEAGLRDDITIRSDDGGLRHRTNARSVDKWAKVESIVHENSIARKRKKHKIMDGTWIVAYDGVLEFCRHQVDRIWRWATSKRTRVVDEFARDSTYAVVTFTSRQAAVAARHCLADSRGADRWVTVPEIPVPPLADAAACNLGSFRGCVRPVTLSINEKQKIIRHHM